MDKSLTIWTRLGQWLRTGSGADTKRDPHATGLDKGLMTDMLTKPVGDKSPRVGGALSGWSRRDHTLQQIQEGNERLMEVLGAVKNYMDKQEKRSDQMAESLGAVADTFSKLPELTENQTAILATIAASMEQSKDHTRELALTMRETPDAIRAQGDALRGFQETLESSPLHDGRMIGSLDEIRGSMSTMTHTADSQVHVLREMREIDERRADALETMINNQSKLQTKLISLMITVVVLIVVGGIAAAIALTAGGG
jgi:hypothetical protein